MGGVKSDVHSVEFTYLFNVLGTREYFMSHHPVKLDTTPDIYNWGVDTIGGIFVSNALYTVYFHRWIPHIWGLTPDHHILWIETTLYYSFKYKTTVVIKLNIRNLQLDYPCIVKF